MSAAFVLLRIGPNAKPATSAIRARFHDEKEQENVRSACANVIGIVGWQEAANFLKKDVHAKDPYVRRWAASHLTGLVQEKPEFVTELIPLFAHEDDAVRDTLSSNLSELDPKLAPYFVD